MANITNEINAFRDAVYGEEVRSAMISAVEKINSEVENNTDKADAAVQRADAAAGNANTAAGSANEVIKLANSAANSATVAAADAKAVRDDILGRLEAGEFKGEAGEKGEPGAKGESGVVALTSGMFYLAVDSDGNLYAYYPDDGVPPSFEYEPASGNLYYVIKD